jgi:hypothetical protein
MTIGASLFLIAAGAILRFAVADSIDGVELETVGLILIIVGVLGLILGLFMMNRPGGPGGGDVVVTRDRDPRY